MSKLREFVKENSDVIWPALCLFFGVLAILFAALKRSGIDIVDNTGTITIVKGNRVLEINRD